MTKIRRGDIVLSYWGSHIRAVGLASGTASSSPKPSFRSGDPGWDDDGWFVPVDFAVLRAPIAPSERFEEIQPLLPRKYSPLNRAGKGQTAYLFEISRTLAEFLLEWSGHDAIGEEQSMESDDAEIDLTRYERSYAALGPTEREEVRKARRGQGAFRRNVLLYEGSCRVTGTAEPTHLVASHIKPWRDSTNAERLDGCNGLLLAPHVDHLFDQGWISFTNDGALLVSEKLSRNVLSEWSIPEKIEVGPFNPRQQVFLEHHRERVLRRWDGAQPVRDRPAES
jgi:hypothetical protein